MMAGGGHGQKAEMNVTPLIDVLLVLIIIFLVIMPVKEHGLQTQIPQQATDSAAAAPLHDVVVTISKDNAITINRQPVEFAALPERLARIYETAPSAHFFVQGDRELAYQDVAQVIDIARGAGWQRIGLMTR